MSKGGFWVPAPNIGSNKPTYEYEAHAWTGTIVGKPYCIKCGLIRLNNAFTAWAVKVGCQNDLHPAYKQNRRKGT